MGRQFCDRAANQRAWQTGHITFRPLDDMGRSSWECRYAMGQRCFETGDGSWRTRACVAERSGGKTPADTASASAVANTSARALTFSSS
jgi:hypothetical protein